MSLPHRLSAHLFLNPLVGAAFLHGDNGAAVPAGLELLGPTGEKFRTTETVKFVGSGGPVEIPIERDGFRDQVREALKLFSRIQFAHDAVIGRMPTQRWHESDLLDRGRFTDIAAGPAPYKRYMTLSFVDDYLYAIPTGSPPVAEKLPVWEANARGVLAGAKRWAQLRWGGL